MELRETVAQAFKQSESSSPPTSIPESAPSSVSSGSSPQVSEVNSAKESADRDVKGRFTKTDNPAKAKISEASPSLLASTSRASKTADEKPAPNDSAADTSPQTATVTTNYKAPAGWKPLAQQAWKQVPAIIQEEVTRRENETSRVLQQSSEARRFADQFQKTIAPYQSMLAAEGTDALQAVNSLLKTAAALRMSAPDYKAQLVAKMCRDFQVPIEALDAALAGQAIPKIQETRESRFDPRFDEFLMHLKSAQNKREQQQLNEVSSELEEFKRNHKHFDMVAEEMSDILEYRANRNIATSLDEAYDLAVKHFPELERAERQTQEAAALANSNESTQRAKNASSTVKAQPVVTAADNKEPQSIEDAVRAAFNFHAGRR